MYVYQPVSLGALSLSPMWLLGIVVVLMVIVAGVGIWDVLRKDDKE